jgi:hypothetical protein
VDPAGWLLGATDSQRNALRMPLQRDEQPYHAEAVAVTSAARRVKGQAASLPTAVQCALRGTVIAD